MQDNSRKNKDLKKIQELVAGLGDMEPSSLLRFLTVKSKKDKDFMVELVAHFAFYMDADEDPQGTVLRYVYSKILKKQSSKIDRQVQQLFGLVKTFQGQVGDYLALDDYRNAFRLLKSIIYFSSKTLHRLETYRNLLDIDSASFRLLETVIDTCQAPELQESIHDFLVELVGSFYYQPMDSEINAIKLLEKTEKYGGDILQLIEAKVKSIDQPRAQKILHFLLYDRYSQDSKYQDKLLDLCRKHVYDLEYLQHVESQLITETAPSYVAEYYNRLLKGTKKPIYADLYYQIAFRIWSREGETANLVDLLRTYHCYFYSEDKLLEISDYLGKRTNTILDQIIKTSSLDNWQEQVLVLRLMFYLHREEEELFEYWKLYMDERFISLFLDRYYEINPEKTEEILYSYCSDQLDALLGHNAIIWTQDILDTVKNKTNLKLSQRLRNRLAAEYDHRHHFSKTLLM